MTNRRILWLLAGLLIAGPAMADFKPDESAVIKDLEAVNKSNDRITIVLWLPSEFWRTALEAGGRVTPKEIDRFMKAIDPYVLLAVVDGEIGVAGSMSFTATDALRAAVSIEDARGKVFRPLNEDAVDGGVKNLVQMMRPGLTNMMGPMGAHMEFFVFPGTDKGGAKVVEASKEGKLIVHVGLQAVRYRLPLGSLLPPMLDQKTGESFPGNYHFNPFTGDKLVPAPADGAKPAG